MLRACQRACTLQIHVNFLGVRWFAAANSPVEVPPQTSVKPFDPKGPLSQIDAYLDGLPMNDPLVKAIKRIKQFRLAQEKLEYERKSSGVAFTADGAVDEDYYVKKLGVHPDFVVELKKAIQGSLVGGGATQSATASCTIDLSEAAARIPKRRTWRTPLVNVVPKLWPVVEKRRAKLMEKKKKFDAEARWLEDLEDSMEDITVHEILERYPDLAQEIKEEIEAGILEPTDAGFKISEHKALEESAH